LSRHLMLSLIRMLFDSWPDLPRLEAFICRCELTTMESRPPRPHGLHSQS
jgi:hypothetical protein